jgi:tetratricopeptide (TPR) repeat protein
MRSSKIASAVMNRSTGSPRWIAAVLAGLMAGNAGSISYAQQSCMGGMAMGRGQAMDGMQAVPRPEQLPVPIRMSGIGNSHIAITATPEAQAWFDQGLNLMHDFWDYESAKAFEQGIRVDPQCAMCWWGLAKVEGSRGGAARAYGTEALAEAVRLKRRTKSAERLYIEAAEAASLAKSGDTTQEVAVLRNLVQKNPKDIEARIFLAIAVEDGYDDAGEPKAGEKEGIALLEGVLQDAPNDSAANHYWIHAIEPGNHPERAIPSAALLASLAPTSGHMVHMPGHIYYRVGNYSAAEHWFAASATADERYMHDQHVSPDDDWNYVHNMMYGIANLMEQGKLADASALSDRLSGARGRLSTTLYIWSARDQMTRLSRRLPVALRIGDWDSVLTLIDQAPLAAGDKTSNLRFLASELHDFAAGMRALERNQVADAQAASAHMDAGLWRFQQDQDGASKDASPPKAEATNVAAKKDAVMVPTMPDAMPDALISSLSVASLELRGGVLAVQGKLEAAKEIYAAAAKKEKKLGYHEPPFYIRPVGETEAAILLQVKDYPGARLAYEAALVERPNSGFGLYGLARVKELSGDMGGAMVGYQTFLKAWPSADSDLPEVVHARAVLNTQTVAGR